MRILVISQYFWPESFRINELVQSLVAKGVEVDVLTGKPNYPQGVIYEGYKVWGVDRSNWQGATIWRIPLFPRGNKSGLRLVLNYLSFVASGLLIAPWLLRKRRYDAIFVFGLSPILQALPALFVSALKKTKLVLWVQDLWPQSLSATGYVTNARVLSAVAAVVRFIYRRSDLVLVQSKAFEAHVHALAPEARVRYYPNSGDARFAAATEPVARHWDYPFSVTFAGNVGAAQNVPVIVEAATLLREHAHIHVVVIGDGSQWQWVKAETERRGLTNVHLLGHKPYADMPDFLYSSSALLVTLRDDPIFNATIPSKIQAYLAAGRPIIACLNGEGGRILDEAGAGVVVPANDALALADAILALSKASDASLKQMGHKGREYFHANFDHEQLVDTLIGYFERESSKD
ncbi:glycosyltransferase family 4 protein [Herbaspirillum sp. WKF16]|uniref:glycosyltransferase family 4 protein n=1 Tax=Herbaspirillum sp. WKF16 TaxID=3028312 RepID=UPI0023AA0132|nr:glycosyltransferase family 4 protein [Herbaspirillum sp. WKF16]WDZ96609.1 glycosyltransferase family 4 protein [Herbaspirillum sp. WKF16]